MTETFDDLDRGYDPSGDLDVTHTQLPPIASPPRSYVIPATMLPGVGTQGTAAQPGAPGSCAAWASTYDLASAAAARSGSYDPSTPDLQASPAFIYMQVLGISAPPCRGSSLSSYFKILAASGTPSLASAPYYANCAELISHYHDPQNQPPNDSAFKLALPTAVKTSDADSIKQALLQNRPLAYGTGLYTDWGGYKGTPVPYVGNGQIAKNPTTGKLAGHCMMIIGYDDHLGAYRIQNSEGLQWGDAGYVWMAYATFNALAQGTAFVY
jgi:C1A family cysteine protease